MGYRLLHWGPILAMSVIVAISSSTVVCHCEWWPLNSLSAVSNFTVFAIWNICTLYNFFCAAFVGPGYVPLNWRPSNEKAIHCLQFCTVCGIYKAPRSHHCRKCQRCVMKMDHHCPWINNCVGHFNHAYFTSFLFFAPCGCVHALSILLPALYRAVYKNYYIFYGTGQEPLVSLSFVAMVGSMLSVGLAVGVMIAVSGLLILQLRGIVRNETGIESWIKEKAEYRDRDDDEPEFIYPYNLGKWKNIRMVLHCRHRPELDGIWWPVRSGCDQYALTVEQLQQKKGKRQRSVLYLVNSHFNGSFFTFIHGIQVCCCQPCVDEQRLKVDAGDKVLVSRFRKYWLYGDLMKVTTIEQHYTERGCGWFPRQCATKLKMDNSSDNSNFELSCVDNGFIKKSN